MANRYSLGPTGIALLLCAAGCSDGGSGTSTGSGGSTASAAVNGATTSTSANGATGGPTGSATSGAGGHDGTLPPPDGFWDTDNIPAAQNVMIFKFLNRTNGHYMDSEVYWHFKTGNIDETHSIAEQPTYDMPANASGRMYFYICPQGDTTCQNDPTKSKYYDFIEHTIGASQYNGNTTRVDAFGLKIAMRLHCTDGFDKAVGEDYATFLEDRDATFAAFLAEAPVEFQPLAQAPNAPYRIVQPGAAGFDANEPNAHYYDSFVDTLWAQNGITIDKPGANGSGLGSYPDLSAAIYRHVGDAPGTFGPDGKLLNHDLWNDSTTFYQAAPADYYARFWHARALDGKAYGFPYDDVGGYSSYISHSQPQYMLVAIGW